MKRILSLGSILCLLTICLSVGFVPAAADQTTVSRPVMGFEGVPLTLALGSADDTAYVYDPQSAVANAVATKNLTLAVQVSGDSKRLAYTAAANLCQPVSLTVAADSSALSDWTGADTVEVAVAAPSHEIKVALGAITRNSTALLPAVGTTAQIETGSGWQTVSVTAQNGFGGGVVTLPANYTGRVRWPLASMTGFSASLLGEIYAVTLLSTSSAAGTTYFDDVTITGAAVAPLPDDPTQTWEAYGFTSYTERSAAGWSSAGTANYYPQSLGSSFNGQYAYEVVDTGKQGGWGRSTGLSGNALCLNLNSKNLSVGSHRMRLRFGAPTRARDPLASNDWSNAEELLFYVDASACTADAPYISLRISEADLDIGETAYEYFEMIAGRTVYLKRDGDTVWTPRTTVGRVTDGKPNPTAVVLEPGFSGWVRMPLKVEDWAYCTGDRRNSVMDLKRVWELWFSVGGYSSATTSTANYSASMTGADIYVDSFTLAGSNVVPASAGLSVLTLPDKRYYTVGQAFDTTGLQIVRRYSDGSARLVTDYTLSGYSSAAGIHTITATAGAETVSFDIMVSTLGRAPTTAELAEHPEAFLPVWSGTRTPHVTSFAEKKQAFLDPTGRMMSVMHRGDRNQYYPENSLEGIVSVIMYGADVVEIDLHRTKDGVLVLMHDDTLTRTTDVTSKKGKNGLPDSDVLHDWTYDQLMQLRLLGPDGKATDCQIPTVRQVIQVCKGRVFITLDKSENFSFLDDIYPMIKDYQAYDTVLIPWNYSVDTAYAIQKKMESECGGLYSLYYAGAKDTIANVQNTINGLNRNGMDPLLRGGEFYPEDVDDWKDFMSNTVSGKYRYYIETLDTSHDNLTVWRQIIHEGYGFIMGNRPYDLIDCIFAPYGDVNGDTKITVADVRMALRASIGKISLTAEQLTVADVNGDGKLTVADTRTLLRYVVGKITRF